MRHLQACLLTCLLLLGPAARADQPLVLDSAIKAQLAGLEPIQGPELAASRLENRIVVVTFFASWCPPCIAEFRHLARVLDELGDAGVTAVAINWFEAFDGFPRDPRRMRRFLKNAHADLSVVSGTASVVQMFGKIDRIPTLFVFDRSGKEAYRFVHQLNAKKTHATFEEIAAALARLG